MTRKITLAAMALALAPTFAVAQGCHGDKQQISASSCMEGHVWDAEKGECVLQPSS